MLDPALQERNSELLRGIRDNDSAVLERLYTSVFPGVAEYVRKNSGTHRDARDVFQEGVLLIYRKLTAGELVLTTELEGYLFGVCRLVWKNARRKIARQEVTIPTEDTYASETPDYAENLLDQQRQRLFRQKLALLGEECRQVLQAFFNGESLRAIAARHDYTEAYAKRKKYRCKNQLVKLVQADPAYTHLKYNGDASAGE